MGLLVFSRFYSMTCLNVGSLSMSSCMFYISVTGVVYASHTFIPPYKRGFFCFDGSITFPEYKDSVSAGQLFIVGAGIPIALVCTGICSLKTGK